MSFKEDFEEMLEDIDGGMGQWIVIRHFDQTTHSKYWNEETKESVGGPPWEYADTVTLGMKQTAFSPARPTARTGITHLESIGTNITTYRYFLKEDATIQEDDEIFDLDASGQTTPTVNYTGTGTGSDIVARYKVRFVHRFLQGNRGEGGYILVITERSFLR